MRSKTEDQLADALGNALLIIVDSAPEWSIFVDRVLRPHCLPALREMELAPRLRHVSRSAAFEE